MTESKREAEILYYLVTAQVGPPLEGPQAGATFWSKPLRLGRPHQKVPYTGLNLYQIFRIIFFHR